MKIFLNIIFICSFIISLIGCKKDSFIYLKNDYREKIIGDYYCSVNEGNYTMGTLVFDTLYNKVIKVEVDKTNSNQNSIIINGSFFTELKLNSNYYECYDNGTQFKNKHAKIINDSLYYYVVFGTNGAHTYYNYKGKK